MFNLKIKPWAHQQEAIALATAPPIQNFAFFMEMGTGKSLTTIGTLVELFNRFSGPMKTIIFAPPLVVPNWVNEWSIYSNLPKTSIIPLYGSGIKRLKTFSHSKANIIITNYESLSMSELFEAFKEWEPEILIFDESHKLKNPTSKRAKLAYELSDPKFYKRQAFNPYKFILTGTPVLNTPMDIFQQFKILDGGETFGRNEWAFRAKYFVDRNARMPSHIRFPNWEPKDLQKDGFDGKGEINKLIYSKAYRKTKDECLDLPPHLRVEIPLEASPEQIRLYNEMKKDFITYYQSKACVAQLAITKLGRLMEICAGFVTVEEPDGSRRRHQIKDNPKEKALEELLEQITDGNESKVIIWTVYAETYEIIRRVCGKLNLKMVECHGEISATAKRENVELFKQDASVRVFMGHPGSGGIGINLVVAGSDITYSRNFNLAEHLQAESRNHRGGAKEEGHEKITHYDLTINGTVDQNALLILASKEEMSEKVLMQKIVGDLQSNEK